MRTGRALLYSAAVSGIALGARSVVDAPVPRSVAAAALLGFVGVMTAGVLFPRLEMFADVQCDLPPSDTPSVALTFDDGPDLDTTPRVLDLLDEAGVKATFFVIARKLDAPRAALVRSMRARGHAIGCHSFAHDRLFSLRSARVVRDDLDRACAAIADATGTRPRLFRPPIGHTSFAIARVADELGMRLVGWSVRAIDGLPTANVARIVERVRGGLVDGAIVCMHDAAERDDFRSTAPETLPAIFATMRERGLRGVALRDDPA